MLSLRTQSRNMPTCSQLCAHTLTSVQQQAIHTLSHAGIAQYSSRLLTAMPRISQLWLNLIIYLPRIASTADAAKLSHNTHEMAFIRSTPKGKNLAGPPGHSPVFQVLGAGAHRIHIMAWGKESTVYVHVYTARSTYAYVLHSKLQTKKPRTLELYIQGTPPKPYRCHGGNKGTWPAALPVAREESIAALERPPFLSWHSSVRDSTVAFCSGHALHTLTC